MVERETIEYDGETWYRYPNAKNSSHRNYFRKHCTYLHHYIWEKYNGQRKKGYHIHHIHNNCGNNAIENLEEIPIKEHLTVRHKMSDERKNQQKELCNIIRPLAAQWHKSEEGHNWHIEHAKQQHFGTQTYGIAKCECCGKEFEKKTKSQKFCSNACKSKSRRDHKIDNVIKICECCGEEFTANKYSKIIFCSRTCKNIKMWQNRRKIK